MAAEDVPMANDCHDPGTGDVTLQTTELISQYHPLLYISTLTAAQICQLYDSITSQTVRQ